MTRTGSAILAVVGMSTAALGLAFAGPESGQGHCALSCTAGTGLVAEAAPTGEIKAGDQAPAFTLTDLNGKTVTLAEELKKAGTKAVLIEWFNPQCPFIVKHHEKHTTFADLHTEFGGKGVTFLAINSGAPGNEGHGEALNKDAAKKWNIAYPILNDEKGAIGKAYGAKTTPHVFIVTADGVVAYQGAIDNDRSADKLGAVNYARKALTEILSGQTVSEANTRPYGCSVKY